VVVDSISASTTKSLSLLICSAICQINSLAIALLTTSFAFVLTSVSLDCVVVDHCGLTPLQCTHFDLTLLALSCY
jgi:hypothetical protein